MDGGRALNIDGDKQADLTVHGGPDKEAYAYPIEHYEFWRKSLSQYGNAKWDVWRELYNRGYTIEGWKSMLNVGDIFRIGFSKVIATQPRMPCYKLGVKFGRMDVLKKFLASGRSGIYFKVLEEGEVGAGDSIIQIKKDINQVGISDIVRLYASDREDIKTMRRAVKVEALPEGWKHYFYEQIRRVEKNHPKGKLL